MLAERAALTEVCLPTTQLWRRSIQFSHQAYHHVSDYHLAAILQGESSSVRFLMVRLVILQCGTNMYAE